MTWPEDRKMFELERKLSSIKDEFEYWEQQTAPRQPLAPHNSQVARITRQLRAVTSSTSTWLERMKADADLLLNDSRALESTILDVQRIWEFFRSKFAQRYVGLFADYLAVADELAWAGYNPARSAADPNLVPSTRVKEPPLVFLNGGWSPFALSRGAGFDAEWVDDEEITRPQFVQLLKDLPIPVIGIPWYQMRFLPDVLTVGHEVGHTVEEDFGLTGRIQELLDAALVKGAVPAERAEGWRAWLGELFADVYGILVAGPAFVSGLMDFLALSPKKIVSDRQPDPGWLDHPPNGLRVQFNLRALELLELVHPLTDLKAAWTARYPQHAMASFDQDVDIVVRALLEGTFPQFGGVRLREVIAFGPTEMQQAAAAMESFRLKLNPSGPIRPMLAGARLAFERDPAAFFQSTADQSVLKSVAAARKGAVRGRPGPPTAASFGVRGAADDASAAADDDAGRDLFEQLAGFRSTT